MVISLIKQENKQQDFQIDPLANHVSDLKERSRGS